MEDFITTRDGLKQFLVDKGKMKELEVRSGASRSTVWRTFEVESEKELVGKYINVWKQAIELVKEIKLLVLEAKEVLSHEA